MPELKLKARIRSGRRRLKALLTMAALLSLTACLPEAARHSSRTALPPSPAPRAGAAQPAAPRPHKAALPAAPRPQPAAAALAEAGPAAVKPPAMAAPNPAAPVPTLAPAPSGADAAAWPSAHNAWAGLARGLINPSLWAPTAFIPLVTAQAGDRLLLAHGLPSLAEAEAASLTETPDLPVQVAQAAQTQFAPLTAGVAPAPMAAPAAQPPQPQPAALIEPAPSAGAADNGGWRIQGPADSPTLARSKKGAVLTADLLIAAYEQTGRRYTPGGLSPAAGFDAAGYMHWIFAQQGVKLPKAPAALAVAGTEIARDDLRPGDVLIYRNPADQSGGWHTGVYSGQGNFLHASPKAGVVTETDAFGPQYAPYFVGGRRFFDDPAAAPLSDTQKMAATTAAVKTALSELGPNDKVVKPAPPPRNKKPAAKKSAAKAARGKTKKAKS